MAVRNGTSGLFQEDYAVNNLEQSATTYVGKVTSRGAWLVQRYVETTGVFDYANQSNNPSVTTYGAAWADRATLSYAAFDTLTGV